MFLLGRIPSVCCVGGPFWVIVTLGGLGWKEYKLLIQSFLNITKTKWSKIKNPLKSLQSIKEEVDFAIKNLAKNYS